MRQKQKILAADQGLYNGFLAMGLFWGLMIPDPEFSRQILLFFLLCITAAGLFGGITVKRGIVFIQALPALLATLLLLLLQTLHDHCQTSNNKPSSC